MRENARVIPEEALVPQAGRQFVYRLAEGPDPDTRVARRVEVKLGLRLPGRVEILEGLQPGDVVVSAGQQRVQRDGMPVRAIDLRAADGARAAASRPPAPATAPAEAPPAPAAGDPCGGPAQQARRAGHRA